MADKTDILCPGCKKKFFVEISKLKKGAVIKCIHCNSEIAVKDDIAGAHKKLLENLSKTISKTIKIKL